MKERGIILTLLVLITSVSYAQENKPFVLKGFIDGIKDGTALYLCNNMGNDTVAKTITKQGSFVFQGKVNGAEAHFIKMDTLVLKVPSTVLFMVSGNLEMKSSMQSWPALELTGSSAQKEYHEVLALYNKYKPAIKEAKTDEERMRIELQRNEELKSYIRSHLNSTYIPRSLEIMEGTYPPEQVMELYNLFPAKVQKSYYGLELKKSIEASLLQFGSILPDFKITMLDGKQESVRQIAAKNRLTLIDFWASWCTPCREQFPEMKKVYDAFHSKGFNIIGIASDDTEVKWRKAVAEEQAPWMHGQDNVTNAFNSVFKFKSYPSMVLVNSEGKMLALYTGFMSGVKPFGLPLRGDNGDELYKTIADILK